MMYRTLVTSPAKGESVPVSVIDAVTVVDGVTIVPITTETMAVDVRDTVAVGVGVVVTGGMVGVNLTRVGGKEGVGDGSGVNVAVI